MRHLIYLDSNATTPISPEVKAAMEPFLTTAYGNPSSSYALGQQARFAIDEAREKVAEAIDAHPSEIYFTASGTESNNLALLGAAFALKEKGRHLIANRTEHMAVLRPLEFLEKELGFSVSYVDSSSEGVIAPSDIQKHIRPDTILITLMTANNETGTLQPVFEVAQIAREKGIFFHSDSVQALGKISVSTKKLGADSLSFSGHKIFGPKGIGALYLKKGRKIRPFLTGGYQERGLRPGTENVAGIVGFGKACELLSVNRGKNTQQYLEMRTILEKKLLKISGTHLNGHPVNRLPNTLNISFDGISGEALVIRLDEEGIMVSSGSACSSGAVAPSHVLKAMRLSEDRIRSAVRFSLEPSLISADIERAAQVVEKLVGELRRK